MNEIVGIVRAQMDALLELLENARALHCRDSRERAALQAADIRQRAHRSARERVRKAAREERERLEREIRMAQAELDTELRRSARTRDLALIRAGRDALEASLMARWRSAEARRSWAECALKEAAEVLRRRNWTLEHPADWPAGERDAIIALASERFGAKLKASPSRALRAGLKILDGGAVIDMSIAGVMANERAIEGELLAEFKRIAAGERI
jgi:pimeloyl-ACP methyl ester carboxylesterase